MEPVTVEERELVAAQEYGCDDHRDEDDLDELGQEEHSPAHSRVLDEVADDLGLALGIEAGHRDVARRRLGRPDGVGDWIAANRDRRGIGAVVDRRSDMAALVMEGDDRIDAKELELEEE